MTINFCRVNLGLQRWAAMLILTLKDSLILILILSLVLVQVLSLSYVTTKHCC